MTYAVHSIAGAQPIANNSTTQTHALGTIVRATDPTYGEGEFIYLLGVASTEVGSLVKYNATTYQTALVTATTVQACPVAVSMAATVASEYGWYQISGNAVLKKTTVAVSPQVTLFISATAGRVKVIASAGLQVVGARSANLTTVVTTTSTVVVTINRPHLQSQIT
ncbi:MAG: hypothetical protein A3E01_00225 [Gammaproteobacteria bacterium RIFCSPHIGHO2_12_FULL_63_22]|nr:MAG: hypothetical protein A3E01_00225 [Gammaproteobacteria bacterium RIFCSPHIGHO2_12_FULL_63_22]